MSITQVIPGRSSQHDLNQNILEAISAMKSIKTIVPICSFCGDVRQESGEWSKDSSVNIASPGINHSHGICPNCVKKQFPQQYQAIIKKAASR